MGQRVVGQAKLDDQIVEWARKRGIESVYSYSIDRTVNEVGKLTLVIGFDPDELESEKE